MKDIMCNWSIVSIIEETLATPSQISITTMVIRTAIFLSLLALGGYFFV
jgi:hypothetical protein